MENRIKAILWDYDGTLVNSVVKNIAVTVDVLRHFDPDIEKHLPEALTSLEKYQEANYRYKNWRELYARCFSLSPEQTDEAGTLWTPCQIANSTVPPLMAPGLQEVVLRLGGALGIPMGICSQNSSENIRRVLAHFEMDRCFGAVVGHDDIPFSCQKPDPYGYLACLERLGMAFNEAEMSGQIFVYIGDHSEDVAFGKNAERQLRQRGLDVRVVCIAAVYGQGQYTDVDGWRLQPDYRAETAEGLLHYLEVLNERGELS